MGQEGSVTQGRGSDPQVELLSNLKNGDHASEDHIDLFGGLVEWSFGLEEQQNLKFVPAVLATRILSVSGGEAYSAVEPLPLQTVIEKRLFLFSQVV